MAAPSMMTCAGIAWVGIAWVEIAWAGIRCEGTAVAGAICPEYDLVIDQ